MEKWIKQIQELAFLLFDLVLEISDLDWCGDHFGFENFIRN